VERAYRPVRAELKRGSGINILSSVKIWARCVSVDAPRALFSDYFSTGPGYS
jgi:hypothetical protein